MASEKSLHLAAQAWCTPATEEIEMDIRLATAFADILDKQAQICAQLLDNAALASKAPDSHG